MREETGIDPIVIVTVCYRKESTPLGNHLKANAEQMGGRFVEWDKLLEEKGVDEVKLEGRNYDNLPEQIASLAENLHAEAGGKPTLLMIDELPGYRAPEAEDQTNFNWLALERIPKEVFLVLIFNPGYYNGKSLLLPGSCLKIHLPTTYRSSAYQISTLASPQL